MKNASSKITFLFLFAVVMLAGCAAVTPLMEAAMKGDAKEMDRLISEGADVNVGVRGRAPPAMGNTFWPR